MIRFKTKPIAVALLGFSLCFSSAVCAHTPLCSCYDNGDNTITCEGGFSDGSSASGVVMRVEDKSGKQLLQGKMDEDSEFTFDKPLVPYRVIFDGGEGHIVENDGDQIVE